MRQVGEVEGEERRGEWQEISGRMRDKGRKGGSGGEQLGLVGMIWCDREEVGMHDEMVRVGRRKE